jgi:membrane-bound lytic murein transglycosylase B
MTEPGVGRRDILIGGAAMLAAGAFGDPAEARNPLPARSQSFAAFVGALWPEAHARGISRSTFDAAFTGVEPDPDVMARTHRQAEFSKTTGQYLLAAVSDKRIAAGSSKYKQWAPWLARAEQRFGVDRYVILGVWGLETNFGQYSGDDSVIRSLATLAYHRYRGDYFRHELLAALAILEGRHIDVAHMTGSWAGAMGQTQFMPSSFRSYAIDFDGDGKRNIWTSVPDAIGSTANYLHKHGWIAGETWGYEVTLPHASGRRDGVGQSFAAWTADGVRRADGGAMPTRGAGRLLTPEGRSGPAFLVTPNFRVIKSYNNSTSYALGVSLLGDRIAGWGDLKGRWPSVARLGGRKLADRT